jgi:hypothetical protein
MIESHTLAVESVDGAPLPEYLDNRYRLHAGLVSAIDEQDAPRALELVRVHNASTTGPTPLGASTTGAGPS